MTLENHIDNATLEMLVDILEEGFATLVETFVTDSQFRFAEIRAGLAENDADAVRRAAHSLKGSSGNVGAQQLAELSQRIELAARDGKLAGLDQILAQLESEFLVVKTILSERLATI